MKDFKNKVVIVTGASSGIGEAMAREFAAQGARVVLGARSVQKLQLIAGDIRSRGNQPHIALNQLVSRLKVTIFHFLQTFAFLFHRQRR